MKRRIKIWLFNDFKMDFFLILVYLRGSTHTFPRLTVVCGWGLYAYRVTCHDFLLVLIWYMVIYSLEKLNHFWMFKETRLNIMLYWYFIQKISRALDDKYKKIINYILNFYPLGHFETGSTIIQNMWIQMHCEI